MCYDDSARPPLPPGQAGSASGEDVVLTAADGNRFSAYLARPEGPAKAGILIFPDIRGLHQFYKDLALRCAEQNVAAIAMDYFGRTAGLSSRDELFDFRPHVQQLRTTTVFADARAAIEHLGSLGAAGSGIFALGFCLGGSLTLFAVAEALGLAGGIAFYAGMSRVLDEEGRTALQIAERATVPVLGLFGGADQGIPVEQVEALDRELDRSGVEHTIQIYPEAPHSFFDRRADEYADASRDAWERVLRFIDQHSQAESR
jgi:carboxymethylenebutenolidase